MKVKMKLCVTLLSVGIIASSLAPAFAAQSEDSSIASSQVTVVAEESKDRFIPKATSISDKIYSGFMSGELTEKSTESPEKIVKNNYNKELSSDTNIKLTKQIKTNKQFKMDKQFKNSMGRTVVKTTQTYNEVPIFGTEQNYHINNDGVIECIVGSTVEDIDNKLASSESSIQTSQQEVLNAIEKHLGIKPEYTENPEFELVLYPVKDEYVYSYKVNISYNKPSYSRSTYYVDANSLSILSIFSQVANAEHPTIGSGIGQFGTVKENLKMVQADDGTCYLENTIENIKTTSGASIRCSDPDSFFDSGTSTNYQQDEVDAHYNASNVLKYFKDTFNRNGNDDKADGSSTYEVSVSESWSVLNALGEKNKIILGVGHGTEGRSLACALDAVAHEFTHGMLFAEGLTYPDYFSNYTQAQQEPYLEQDSLHEGISDVFGTICEYFIPSEGSFDWNMAEDTGTIFRDCSNPLINDYNDYLANTKKESHEGGGVISKAASLIAMGGTHNGKSVTGIGYTKLANIFYNAINDGYLISGMTFRQFAEATVQSAYLLYGYNSSEIQSVKDAFVAVGIFTDLLKSFTLSCRGGLTIQFKWDSNGISDDRYAIYRKVTGSSDDFVKLLETTYTKDSVETLLGSCDFCLAKVDSTGNRISDFSDVYTVESYCGAPVNFRMTYRGGLTVQFSWDCTYGTRYAIYRKITGSSDALIKVNETTSTTDNAETLLGSCDFYVAQVDSDGNRISYFSDVYTVESYSGAPENFNLSQRSGLTVQFSWAGTSGNYYAIYRKITGSTDAPVKVTEITTDTTCTAETLPGSYDFYVAQVDSDGNRVSNFSNVYTVIS